MINNNFMKHFIGIDIGGVSIKGAIISENGDVITRSCVPTFNDENKIASLDNLFSLISELVNQANIDGHKLTGIGIGCPGTIDNKTGSIDFANNLNWENVPLKKLVEEKFNIETKLTNDANAATLGEAKFGAGKNFKNLIMLTIGTGIGGGIIIDHQLYEGNLGKGAELGHITLFMNGLECSCGRKGCAEKYASASAFIEQAKQAAQSNKDSMLYKNVNGDLNDITGKMIFDIAKQGDLIAIQVIDTFVSYLSETILNYCNIFRPEAIILFGGITLQKEYLTDKVVKYLDDRKYG
jgi:glucokinase